MQILPGGGKQGRGSLMFRAIKADSFQEHVETTGETSRCDEIGCFFHGAFADCRSTTRHLSRGLTQWLISTMIRSGFQQYEGTQVRKRASQGRAAKAPRRKEAQREAAGFFPRPFAAWRLAVR